MALREQIVRTTRQWIQAHNDLAAGKARVAALMADDFIERTHPSSLQSPPRNREEYAAFQSWACTLFDSYKATETDMAVNEAQCKVVYYLNAEATAPAGEYRIPSQNSTNPLWNP
jgi:hypothetical protein